jgi:hypothetical protein
MENVLKKIGQFLESDRSVLRCQTRTRWAKNSLWQTRGYALNMGYDVTEYAKVGGEHNATNHWSTSPTVKHQRVVIIHQYLLSPTTPVQVWPTNKYIFLQQSDIPWVGRKAIEPYCRVGMEFHREQWKYLYDDEYNEFYVFHLVLLRLGVDLDYSIRCLILHYLRYTQTRCVSDSCVCRGEATACSASSYDSLVSLVDDLLRNDPAHKRRVDEL